MANSSSVGPSQTQEGDIANEGGTAPGGTIAFMSAKGDPSRLDPITAAHMQHYGVADGAPDGSGNVPIHPGLVPGLFRTPRNLTSPDGEASKIQNDATANDGRPISPDGRHRGESPEVPKTSRGSYRP